MARFDKWGDIALQVLLVALSIFEIVSARNVDQGSTLKLSSVYCTGSMEPAITCLDAVWVESEFAPEDIRVGDVISYRTEGDSPGYMHRVVERKEEGGTHYFLTKGDALDEPDPEWTPHTRVEWLVVGVERNFHSENAALRQQVNKAKKDLDMAQWQYESLYLHYCGVLPDAPCDTSPAKLNELFDLYLVFLDASCAFDEAYRLAWPYHQSQSGC